MASYTPEIKRILREHGRTFVRKGKGDHEIWYSPITNRKLPRGQQYQVAPLG
jgi:hypothetical protein